jgi:hypothetical protein
MPGYSPTAAAQALDSLSGGTVNVIAFVQLNTADPGATGASEATSTRQACTWNAANSGTRTKTNITAMTFAPTAGTPNTHFSTWSASTAGTFGISGALGSSVTAASVTVAAAALSLSA